MTAAAAVIGIASGLVTLTSGDAASRADVEAVVRQGDRSPVDFTAGAVSMSLTALGRVEAEPGAGALTLRTGDEADVLVELTNIGNENSSQVEILVDVPEGLAVLHGTTRYYIGDRDGEVDERDVFSPGDRHWTALGRFGPNSTGYVTFEITTSADFGCGQTSLPIAVLGRAAEAPGGSEARTEVVVHIDGTCQ